MIYEKLGGHLRKPYLNETWSTRASAHESLKAQLYVLGYKEKLMPVLEAGQGTKVDCLYLKDNQPVCGLEIDYSIKKKSIKKLNQIPDIERIIISYGPIYSWWRAKSRCKGLLDGIKLFRINI